MNAGLVNCDTYQSESDACIQQEGIQIVTRLQQNPYGSDGCYKDVSHQDINPSRLRQYQREHVTSSNSSYQQYNANNSTNFQIHATTIYAEAEYDCQNNEQQGCGSRSRASHEGTSNDISKCCYNNNQGYISKNRE